jgi:hypothetical protein
MKYFCATVLLLLIVIFHVSGQGGAAIPSNLRATSTLEGLTTLTPNELLYGIPLPPKTLIGDAYLNKEWRGANIMLFTKETVLEGFPMRYDLLKDELEVNSKSGIKVLEGRRVKSFVWLDSITRQPQFFVSAVQYKDEDNEKLKGFFEVLVDGKMPLFKKINASIKTADYNVQFNMGSRDDKVIRKEVFYYLKDGVVYQIPKSKKKFPDIFTDKASVMEDFVKTNGLSSDSEGDLRKIFMHYNSL